MAQLKGRTMYIHFQFTSGANPYITFTSCAKRNFMGRCKRRGYEVEKIRDGFYMVNDST